MAITYRVLGQINPAANTQTTIYTVPAATSTIVSTVSICNTNSLATTFSLAVQPQGAALARQHVQLSEGGADPFFTGCIRYASGG